MGDFGAHSRSLALALFASGALLLAIEVPRHAVAQSHPTMASVIPDGGSGAIEGNIQSVAASSRQVAIVSQSGHPLTLVAGPDIRLDNIGPGDAVSALYSRSVLWVLSGASTPVPNGATATVEHIAKTPGGVGPEATQISGRVMKVDSENHSFDFVDATGGGVYTILVTDPSRIAMRPMLKIGAGITVSMTPLTINAMTKCGWFGCA